MYVRPAARSRGVAPALLAALEDPARALGYTAARLDTGPKQVHGLALYRSAGYVEVPPTTTTRSPASGARSAWPSRTDHRGGAPGAPSSSASRVALTWRRDHPSDDRRRRQLPVGPGADGRPLRDAGAGRHAPRARGHRPRAAAQDGGAGPQAERRHGRQGDGRHHDRPPAPPSTAPTSSSCASRPAASAPWRSTSTCRPPTASPRRWATPSGPGGINRALRNIPVLVGIGKAMEERCPDAWLFNITNPMTALTRSVCRETSIKTVGLCHEVGNFCMDLAIALGRPFEAVSASVTGRQPLPGAHLARGRRRRRLRRAAQAGRRGRRPGVAGPVPGPPRGREVLQARLRPAPPLQADAARPLGHLPGGRRPAHRRVRLVRARRPSPTGARPTTSSSARSRGASSTRPSTSPTSTPGWPAPRTCRPGSRASCPRR